MSTARLQSIELGGDGDCDQDERGDEPATVMSTALGELATVRDAACFEEAAGRLDENLSGQPCEFDPALEPRGDTLATTLDVARRGYRPLFAAARRATNRYPGAIGELLSQELLSWMVFGHQLGSDLIMRLADDLLVDEPKLS